MEVTSVAIRWISGYSFYMENDWTDNILKCFSLHENEITRKTLKVMFAILKDNMF